MDKFSTKFKTRNNKLFIIIYIYTNKNNIKIKHPIEVLIDTGAVISIIKTDDLLGLNIHREYTGIALSTPHSVRYLNSIEVPESERLYKFDIPMISIGTKLLFNLRLGSNDLINSEVSVIGMDILGHFNIFINYEKNSLDFSKREDIYDLFTLDNLNSNGILLSSMEPFEHTITGIELETGDIPDIL